MNIDKITVSTEEVCQALTLWFKQMYGHSFEVKDVNKRYSFESEWEVTLADPTKKETTPPVDFIEPVPPGAVEGA